MSQKILGITARRGEMVGIVVGFRIGYMIPHIFLFMQIDIHNNDQSVMVLFATLLETNQMYC